MKKTILAIIALLSFAAVHSQSTNEAQIRVTLTDYIEGSSYNKIDQIKKAFANNATLYLSNKDGDFNRYTPEQYTEFFKNGTTGKFNGRVGKILDIEIERDIATAKAEIVISERKAKYIDLFLLKNIVGEGWKIISKTATLIDFSEYVGRDEKLDNFTLQRLIVQNDAGEILMEQYEQGWSPPSMYSNTRQSTKESMDSLALSRGIKISKSELRAYPTYKFAYHGQVSFRSYFVAKYEEGNLIPPKDALAMKWMPVAEALSKIPVEAIRLITKQVLEFPEQVWGGSFLISENGELHETLILEEFYPLFGAKR